MNPNHHKPILLTFFTLLLQLPNPINTSPSPPITALYAFGDSTVDSGNNNYIPTLFQSNHPPYGRSFPAKLSTGRFSDGKLATDFIASSLGLKPTLPAYLNPSVKPVDLLTGVSFASAGGGLDDRTAMMSLTLTMDKQWSYFEEAVGKMKSVVGDSETNRVIKNALFVISAGTNDMIFNVYDHVLGRFISVSDYQDYLLSKVETFIQRLQDAGARRITVAGLPPIGCLPVQVTLGTVTIPRIFHHRICTKNQNADSRLYNQKLRKLNFRLSQRLQGSKILYLDIYTPLIDMIKHPKGLSSPRAWSTPRGRNPTILLLKACLPPLPSELNSIHPDIFLWRNSPNTTSASFSSSMTWKSLHPDPPPVDWFSSIWFQGNIPKHSFISWVAARNRLPTRDRLITWGMNVSPLCPLCDSVDESRNHLFFMCSYSMELWVKLFQSSSLTPPVDFDTCLLWLKSPSTNKKLKGICKLIFQAAVYVLWKERNARIHTSSSRSVCSLLKEIHLNLRAKLYGLDQKVLTGSTSHRPTLLDPTYLQLWFRDFQP